MANGRYKVEYAASALENLRSLPKREADQILRKVLRLEHGLHGNIKRLQNADAAFRLRMGDYRILFDVIGDRIVIQKVGNRKTFMISAPPQKPVLKRQQKSVLKQINSLREQMEDLNDYLDLLEARARNKGKPVSVILPIADYEELLERAEDAKDVAWLKAARKKPRQYRPLEDYLAGRR